jgi:hypothetical protein
MHIYEGHVDSRLWSGVSLELPRQFSATRSLLETIRAEGIDPYQYRRMIGRSQPVKQVRHDPKRYHEHATSRWTPRINSAAPEGRVGSEFTPKSTPEGRMDWRYGPEPYRPTRTEPVEPVTRFDPSYQHRTSQKEFKSTMEDRIGPISHFRPDATYGKRRAGSRCVYVYKK